MIRGLHRSACSMEGVASTMVFEKGVVDSDGETRMQFSGEAFSV